MKWCFRENSSLRGVDSIIQCVSFEIDWTRGVHRIKFIWLWIIQYSVWEVKGCIFLGEAFRWLISVKKIVLGWPYCFTRQLLCNRRKNTIKSDFNKIKQYINFVCLWRKSSEFRRLYLHSPSSVRGRLVWIQNWVWCILERLLAL